MTRITDPWALGAASTGQSASVTLLISGVPVSGRLCPAADYWAWHKEVMMRMGLAGEPYRVPSGGIPEPSETWQRQVADQWKERGGEEEPTFPIIYLRNAFAKTDPDPARWFRAPYLVVNADSVDAMMPGSEPDPMYPRAGTE